MVGQAAGVGTHYKQYAGEAKQYLRQSAVTLTAQARCLFADQQSRNAKTWLERVRRHYRNG